MLSKRFHNCTGEYNSHCVIFYIINSNADFVCKLVFCNDIIIMVIFRCYSFKEHIALS